MRKLFIILGAGSVFIALLFMIYLSKSAISAVEEEPIVKAKYAQESEIQRLDAEYMDFYGLGFFDTTLPVIFVDTGDQDINKDTLTMSKVSILDSYNDEQIHNISEVPDLTLNAGIKARGASSYHFDKTQYRLTFFKDPEGRKKYPYDLFGMGAADSWVLHGPFLDRTLARNYMGYHLGNQIMEWAPECRYFELFLDGRYKGVYLAVEPVSVAEGRLDLSQYSLLAGKTAYIIDRNREATDLNPLQTYGKLYGYTSNNLYVQYPGSKSITKKQYDWITNDISAFEMTLYGEYYKDPVNGYAAHIDVDNFVDYFILNEVTMNHDAGALSTYFYKNINGKLKMAVWDFNNCYDNFQWFTEDYDEFYLIKMPWFRRLLSDRAFIDKVVKRYYELRENQLSVENMYSLLDESQAILGDAIDRNFVIWGYSFRRGLLSGPGRDPENYQEADAQLRQAIVTRFEFLDEHITDLYDLCLE